MGYRRNMWGAKGCVQIIHEVSSYIHVYIYNFFVDIYRHIDINIFIYIYIWFQYWYIYKKKTNLCFFILTPVPSVSLNDWNPRSGFSTYQIWGVDRFHSHFFLCFGHMFSCFALFRCRFCVERENDLKEIHNHFRRFGWNPRHLKKKKYLQEKNNSRFLIQEKTYTNLLNLADFDQWLY